MQQGDLVGTEAECRKAVALSPLIRTPTMPEGTPINASAVKLLGEICLRLGKNREALQCFLGVHPHMVGGGTNLNVVIAYCRLGEYQNAKRFYADPLWKLRSTVSAEDFPGTDDLASLEASALLGRAIDLAAYGQEGMRDALRDLLRAEQLVPKNPLVAYFTGRVLLDLDRAEEALPRFRRAATYGHGLIVEKARRKIKSIEYWFRFHPPAASGHAP